MMVLESLMKIPASLKSEIAYSRKLFDAGLNAATAVRDGTPNQTLTPELARAARGAWAPAAIGAAIGVLGLCLARRGRSGRDALMGGLVGGVLGFGGGVIWSSREAAAEIARQAARNLGTVRDAHWLEKHPITYA
jgi:hypothetical protein